MKRILSLFMVIVFAFSLISVSNTVFALYDEFTIWEGADLNSINHVSAAAGYNSEIFRDGKSRSVQVTPKYYDEGESRDKGFELIKIYNDYMDFSDYSYLNVWIYSPEIYSTNEVTKEFSIRIYSEFNGANSNTGRGHFKIDWQGWKLLTVPFTDIDEYDGKTVDWEKIGKISYNTYSKATQWDYDDYLCFDKIWLSVEDPTNFSVDNEIAFEGSTATPATTTNARLSSKAVLIKTDVSDTEQKINFSESVDASSYKYMNAWVYCPSDASYELNGAITTPLIRYRIYDSSGKRLSAQKNQDDGGRPYPFCKVDWIGWKIVSIPFDLLTIQEGFQIESLKQLSFYVNANGWTVFNAPIPLYVDKIWLSNEVPQELELTGIYPKNEYKYISPVNTEISLSFNNEIKKIDESLITIEETLTGNPYIGDMSFETEVNILKIKLDNKLLPGTEYTFSITGTTAANDFLDEYGQWLKDDITMSFTTAPDLSGATKPLIETQADGSVSASVTVTNLGASTFDPVLYLAAYASDGSMLALEKEAYSSGTEMTAVLSSGEIAAAEKYSAFVIADKDDVIPSLIAHSALPELPFNTDVFDITAPFPSTPVVTVTKPPVQSYGVTTFEGSAGVPFSTVLLTVKQSDSIILSVPVTTDENGNFTYDTKITANGILDYEVSLYGVSSDGDSFLNLTDSAKTSVVNAVNSAADVSGVKTAMTSDPQIRYYGFGMGTDDTENTDIAQLIFDNKPHLSFEEIVPYVNKTRNLYTAIKNLNWSEIDAVICSDGLATSDGLLALTSSEAYNYYLGLDSVSRSKVCEYMPTTLPYASISAFRSGFEAAVASFKQSLVSPPPGGPAGPVSTKPTNPGPSYNVEAGGTGSVPTAPASVFNDLGSHQWAKTAIEALYNRGIISKPTDGNYRPADDITREEFVKLIMSYVKFPGGENSALFSDMTVGEWYVPYIMSAVENGIINGTSNGEFGIGEDIKRCDMAVIIWRVLQKLNPNITYNNTGLNYNDASDIPEYAAEAITALTSLGLLNGDNLGRINPTATLTRAEAAQVIYNLILFLE